ncbi:MAG: medium chain dehydrogenase/reductase family protein [Caldilineaceae bacterium]
MTQNHRIIISRKGGLNVLQLIEEPIPVPKHGEVLVHVLCAGVAAADLAMREGVYPGTTPQIPFTPGYDICGVIEKVGEDVTHLQAGQRVVALTVVGGYCEYICLPATQLAVVPSGVDSAQASALVLNYLTAWQMLHRFARVQPSERMLVHGAAGGAGSALLELGRLAGLEIYGTASTSKQTFIKQLGATPIDYTKQNFVKEINRFTQTGVDAVFDPIGGTHWRQSYQSLRPGGRLLAYGLGTAMPNGRVSIAKFLAALLTMPRYSPLTLFTDNKVVMGYFIHTLVQQRPEWFAPDLEHLIDLLAQQKIAPVVGEQIPLAEASRAHELLGKKAVLGKIVLICV